MTDTFNCGHAITVENMSKGKFKNGKQYYKCLTCQVDKQRVRRKFDRLGIRPGLLEQAWQS